MTDATEAPMRISGAVWRPEPEPDHATVVRIVAEARAMELVEALKCAIAGSPHWRWQAQRLLEAIHDGQMPEPR